jgi:hypothetical protein
MSPFYRRLLKISRLTHLYLTLFGLVLILFFAITGFMLNHENWFIPDEASTREQKGTLPTALLKPANKFEICEAIRKDFGVQGLVNRFEEEEERIKVEFHRPGQKVQAEIEIETGATEVTFESYGWTGIVTDLHKGKSSGNTWSLVIDGTCILLLIISATGLILWSSLKTRGKWGAVMLLLGAAATYALYHWGVP